MSIETKFGNASLRNGRYVISSNEKGNRGKLLHRAIFEDFYKIKLPSDIVIHHDDGNPQNNEIWNLIPMTKAEHNTIHTKGRKWSEEAKHRMSIERSKENHPMYGKHHSKESREKMSRNHKDFTGKNHPQYRHDIDNQELLKEYQETGISRRQLAKKYNCSKTFIDTRLRKAKEELEYNDTYESQH